MWFENARNNYIFIDGKLTLLKRLWLMVNGYHQSDMTAKNLTHVEEEKDEIYRFLARRKQSGV